MSPEGKGKFQVYEKMIINFNVGSVSINIPRRSCPEFLEIRIHLGKTFRAVDKAICTPANSLDCKEIKKFIVYLRPDLKVKIDTCKEVDEVLNVIRDNCSLLNIKLLEAVVDEFIKDAKEAIVDYKEHLKKFSEELKVNFCLEEKIALCSSLKCETVTVTVDKDVEKICFEDISILMKLAFETLSSSICVCVIRRDNSFTIICSFPLTLSGSLISTALKNLKVLKEKGIIKLTIGYCTVYDYKEVNKKYFLFQCLLFIFHKAGCILWQRRQSKGFFRYKPYNMEHLYIS